MDLGPHGLPLVVDVPACAKASAPMVKVADNEKDVILGCGDPMEAALSGPVFAIQIGPAEGKIWKKEIAEMPGFTGFTKEEPELLQWQEGLDPKGQTFMLRVTIAGRAYTCLSQFASADPAPLVDDRGVPVAAREVVEERRSERRSEGERARVRLARGASPCSCRYDSRSGPDRRLGPAHPEEVA